MNPIGRLYASLATIRKLPQRMVDSGIKMSCEVSTSFCKTPGEVLDYTVDWSSWLQSGENISTSDWTVASGLTEDSSTNTTTGATIWLSSGTNGTSYLVINKIVTDAATPRTAERAFLIHVNIR